MKIRHAMWLSGFLIFNQVGASEDRYRLAGIVGSGEFRAALIEIDGREQKLVRVNDALGSDRLIEVHKDWVLISGLRGERKLRLQGLPSDAVPSSPVRTGGAELRSEKFRVLDKLRREVDELEPEVARKRFNAAVGLGESAHIQAVDHRGFESISEMVRYVTNVLGEDGGVVRFDIAGDRHNEMYLKIDWE